MKSFLPRLLLSIALLASAGLANAEDPGALPDGKDIPASSDHPAIQRFDGSSIRFYEKKAFDELEIAVGPVKDDKPKTITVEGAHTTIVYVMPKDVSTLEAIRGYQAELEKLGEVKLLFKGMNGGGKQELDDGVNEFVTRIYGDNAPSRWMNWNREYRYAAFRVKTPERVMYVSLYSGMNAETSGADYWVVKANRVGVRLDVIDMKAMESRMVTVKAEDMSAELKKDGSVSLYGILFDTNKADLKPDSAQALEQIGKLMAADDSLKLLVVGHTDTVGAFESNRDLSQRRAKSVVAALVTEYKVAPSRLQAFGASFAAPVASNAAEAGRAKNRRVELVSY